MKHTHTTSPLSEQLIARGLVNQYTTEHLATIVDGEKRTIYLGADPTGDSMHVGHLAALMPLRYMADAGHRIIFLAGGATGMIGDPKPNVERALLPREVVAKNVVALKAQVAQVLGLEDLTVVDNYDWLGTFSLIDFLRDVGKHFTVNALVKKDAIAARMQSEDGITYTEFSYPLLQAYDFFHLFTTHHCDVQIGGSDQWGNIVAGVDLVRRKTGKEVYAMTFPLVVDKATGKKFGKSEGNAVWLDKQKTSVFSFYQFWLNTSDESVEDFLKRFTLLPLAEIEEAVHVHREHMGARTAQRLLARAVTALVHGEDEARRAEETTHLLFGEGRIADVHDTDMFLHDAPHTTVHAGDALVDVLVAGELASSKREAREFITGGAVSLGGVKVTDAAYTLSANDFEKNGLQLLKRGKQKVRVLVIAGE